MTRRPITMLSAAALLALPTLAIASPGKGGDDDRRDGGGGSSRTEVRTGAGTIASYDGSTLVITLADGTTVTGRVTKRTEIECSRVSSSSATRSKHGSDDGPGDDRGGDRDRDRDRDDDSPSTSPSPSPSPKPSPKPSPSPAADYPGGTTPAGTTPAGTTPAGTTPGARPRCGRGLLVAGASVRKSRVRNGTFKKVHLYRR